MQSVARRRGARSLRWTAIALVMALFAAACSSDEPAGNADTAATSQEGSGTVADGPAPATGPGDPDLEEFLNAPAAPVSAEVTLAESGAAAATIGADGGSVEANGPGGAHYRLDVPAGALADDTTIRLTPIADATSAVLDGFTGGVQFEPEGLMMLVPATLTISGVDVPDDVAAFSYQGDGEEVTSAPAAAGDGSVAVTILHFSGTINGPPASDPPPNFPEDPGRRMIELLKDNLARTGECLQLSSNLPARVTLENFYVNWYRSKVGPMLQAGAGDDMVLGKAIDELIRWVLLPIAWRQAGYICDSEPYLEDAGAEFHDAAFDLLSKGLFNAIDIAAQQCAAVPDIGEARNIAGWTAVAASIEQAYPDIKLKQAEPEPGSPNEGEGALEGPDLEYGLDKLFQCASFKLTFQTAVRAEQGQAAYGGTVKSEIIGMVPTALAQLFGREGNDQADAEPTYESSALTDVGSSCSVTTGIEADPLSVPVVDPPIPEPRRKVPMPTSGPATSLAGFGPGRGAPPGEAGGVVVIKGLQTKESLDIVCPGIEQSIDTPGQVAGLFNGMHMDELDQGFGGFVIDLEEGSGNVIGKKIYDRTGTLDGVPVTELTTIQLVHTPTTSG